MAETDLISRQAAIDAVLDMKVEHRVSWMDAVVDTLDALPSAQPEITLELAIEYLDAIGWMQDHKKALTDKSMIHQQKEQAYLQGWEDAHKVFREEITKLVGELR